MAASLFGSDVAAQVVTWANPLRPVDASPVAEPISPPIPGNAGASLRDRTRPALPAPSGPADAAADDRAAGAPPCGTEADDGLLAIRQLSVDIRPAAGDLPGNPAAANFAGAGEVHQGAGTSRPWPLHCYWWEAPAVCHRPLYFEQVNLERYGYSCGLAQPLVSAAHFFGTIPALPYLMVAEPCRECVYTLGHYRPGSCAPFQLHYPPLSLKGAAAEAGVLTGLIFAIP